MYPRIRQQFRVRRSLLGERSLKAAPAHHQRFGHRVDMKVFIAQKRFDLKLHETGQVFGKAVSFDAFREVLLRTPEIWEPSAQEGAGNCHVARLDALIDTRFFEATVCRKGFFTSKGQPDFAWRPMGPQCAPESHDGYRKGFQL